MLYILVQQQVKDFATWKSTFDSLEDVRKSFGQTSQKIFQNRDNPNTLTLIFGWNSFEKAQTYYSSPELRQAMQNAGVIPPPTITFLEGE